jgi:hypothetical protein
VIFGLQNLAHRSLSLSPEVSASDVSATNLSPAPSPSERVPD